LKPSVYSMFIPFDWSPMTFLSRGKIVEGTDLSTFLGAQPPRSIALQAADLSSPGLQFMYWMWSVAQLQKEPLQKIGSLLKPKIHSFSPEWSASYSFFQSGSAQTVFTYLTSLVYHREKKEDFNYAQFSEGHPAQIEYVGIPDQCMSCGIAESFVNFLTEPDIQKLIMTKNYMLPAIAGVTAGTEFEKLPQLKILPHANMDTFVDEQKSILTDWKASTGD
jgi:thiamine transport system substrate-binding protein